MSHPQIKTRRLRAAFVVALLFSLLVSSAPVFAQQCFISLDEGVDLNLNEIMQCAEQRYGYDPNAIRRAQRKEGAPEASIFFDKTDPKEGEKVTATAVPKGFKNSAEELYYVWYILHTDEDGDVLDTDDDGDLGDEIENGKREAMGRVARGSFNPLLFNVTRDRYDRDGDFDNDGFRAPFGGINGVGAKTAGDEFLNQYEQIDEYGVVPFRTITRCYKHNFGIKSDIEHVEADANLDSGRDMVIECKHAFPEADPRTQRVQYEGADYRCADDFDIGDGHFNNKEEGCWQLDPLNPDTDGDGIEDEKDVAGLNQQHFTWNFRPGDRVGVIIEGTSMIPTNEDALNSYYKIMWATPGICNRSDVNILDDDGCEERDDYGFNFYQTQPVDEKGQQNLETNLSFAPQNPQFDPYEPETSDLITVSAVVNNEVTDDRFVYYEWSVYRCDENMENCITEQTYNERLLERDPNAPLHLTPDCRPGYDQRAAACAITTETPLKGIGRKQISFIPKKEVMKASKEYLKVVLKTRRRESDAKYAVSDILIPVTQNDIAMEFYTVNKQGDTYTLGDKICDQGLYRQLCPVYPNQVIGVKAVPRLQSGNSFRIESYTWLLGSEPMDPPKICQFDRCDLNNIIYIPIIGANMDIGSITVNAKRRNGNDLVAERMYSVNAPFAKIYSNDNATAWQYQPGDVEPSDDVWETNVGNRLSFRADLS